MCAGITTYSPLKKKRIGPGCRMGIAGIGGLGHIAIKLAKAMGAHVVAITSTKWKLDDSIRIGADESILVSDNTLKDMNGSLDFIIDTIPVAHDLDLYIELLAYGGCICVLGFFDTMEFDNSLLADKNRSIMSSITGGRDETIEMLQFCANHGIEPDVEFVNMKDINKTYDKISNSKVKYRFVIALDQ